MGRGTQLPALFFFVHGLTAFYFMKFEHEKTDTRMMNNHLLF